VNFGRVNLRIAGWLFLTVSGSAGLALADRVEVKMPVPMAAARVLDREFLEVRAKLLELAASFDRLDRGEGSVESDTRLELFHQALAILQSDDDGRAERIQLLFSRQFDKNWREELNVSSKI